MMRALFAAVLVTLCAVAHAEPVTVVKVIDGDTVWVTRATDSVKVRLRYIDAPESCQAHGAESAALLSSMALNKTAELKITGRSYDRFVGTLIVNGVDISGAMVTFGGAWVYRQATPKKSPLRAQEDAARASNIGLWAAPSPQEPWLFRKTNKCTHKGK